MRWQDRRESNNVEDRRQQRGGIPIGGKGRLILLVVVMVAGYYGVDLSPAQRTDHPEPAPASGDVSAGQGSSPGSPR